MRGQMGAPWTTSVASIMALKQLSRLFYLAINYFWHPKLGGITPSRIIFAKVFGCWVLGVNDMPCYPRETSPRSFHSRCLIPRSLGAGRSRFASTSQPLDDLGSFMVWPLRGHRMACRTCPPHFPARGARWAVQLGTGAAEGTRALRAGNDPA